MVYISSSNLSLLYSLLRTSRSNGTTLVVAFATLKLHLHNAPSQLLRGIIVVALESEDVEVREHFIFSAVHNLAFTVANAVDLLRGETHQDDRCLLVFGLWKQHEIRLEAEADNLDLLGVAYRGPNDVHVVDAQDSRIHHQT